MRLLVASLIFLAAVLDMNFGAGTASLEVAALSSALLLVLTVIADFLWFDPPARRTSASGRKEKAADAVGPPPS